MAFRETGSPLLNELRPLPEIGEDRPHSSFSTPGTFELPWEQAPQAPQDLRIRPREQIVSATEYREQFERQLAQVGVASENSLRRLQEENDRLRQELADYKDLYQTCEQELLKSEKARAELQGRLSRLMADPQAQSDAAVDYAELYLKAEALKREVDSLAKVLRDHPPTNKPSR